MLDFLLNSSACRNFLTCMLIHQLAQKCPVSYALSYAVLHLVLQDLQAEVEAQQGVYDSLASTGNQLLPTMGAPDAQKLQSRLEEMNRRWLLLMTKSMEIRSVPFHLLTKSLETKSFPFHLLTK